MNKTPIQWTDLSWNPLLGCRRASPGCEHCYAERLIATRMSKNPKLPLYHDLARVTAKGEPQFTGVRRLVPDRLDEPLRKRAPSRIFVCDMGDIFFEGHPFEDIAAVFGVMAAAPRHTFQVLTKRASRMAEFFAWVKERAPENIRGGKGVVISAAEEALDLRPVGFVGALESVERGVQTQRAANLAGIFYEACIMNTAIGWPLPNVWLGVSVEDQQRADERIPHLLRCPAVVRFLSVEPQLEAIDFRNVPGFNRIGLDLSGWWVIQGGESGKGARPFDLAWARSMRDQCKAAGVAYFLKQLGSNSHTTWEDITSGGWGMDAKFWQRMPNESTHRLSFLDSHGGNESEWPADLRGCRAFPEVRP